MRRTTPPALLAALALGLSACGGGTDVDLTPVREAIDALDSAQGDLRSRMSTIEQSLTAIGATNGDEENAVAAGILEQLTALEAALEELRLDLTQLESDGAADSEQLTERLAQVEAQLNGTSSALTNIRDDIAKLREDHELLKQRFERHLQDHG